MNLYYNWQLHQSMHNYKSIAILISNVRFIACVGCMNVHMTGCVCTSVCCAPSCAGQQLKSLIAHKSANKQTEYALIFREARVLFACVQRKKKILFETQDIALV